MHADIPRLIALRDGEPVAADIAGHVRECPQCARKLAALAQVQAGLRELPPVAPPPGAWSRIVARRALESEPRPSRRTPARRAAALAACVAVLVAAVFFLQPPTGIDDDTVMPVAATPSTPELQQRSRELEYLLDRYGAHRVMSLRTAGTISELQDSIALIDFQLNAASGEARQRALWRQRVELMETLVTVHAAESYLDSI